MKDYNCHIGLKLRIYPSDKQKKIIKMNGGASRYIYNKLVADNNEKYSLQGTTQGRYLTGGVPPVRFSM